MSEKQEQAILLARAPLIFLWAEQLKAARDAMDAFFKENGSGLSFQDLLGVSSLATPTFWELSQRVEWWVAVPATVATPSFVCPMHAVSQVTWVSNMCFWNRHPTPSSSRVMRSHACAHVGDSLRETPPLVDVGRPA